MTDKALLGAEPISAETIRAAIRKIRDTPPTYHGCGDDPHVFHPAHVRGARRTTAG